LIDFPLKLAGGKGRGLEVRSCGKRGGPGAEIEAPLVQTNLKTKAAMDNEAPIKRPLSREKNFLRGVF